MNINADDVQMLGIDSEGFDLKAYLQYLRFTLGDEMNDMSEARKKLVSMVRKN